MPRFERNTNKCNALLAVPSTSHATPIKLLGAIGKSSTATSIESTAIIWKKGLTPYSRSSSVGPRPTFYPIGGQAPSGKMDSTVNKRSMLSTTETISNGKERLLIPPRDRLRKSASCIDPVTCNSAVHKLRISTSMWSLPSYAKEDRRSEGDKLTKKKRRFPSPRMNVAAQMRVNRARGAQQPALFKEGASVRRLKLNSKENLSPEIIRTRAADMNSVRALRIHQKVLIKMQSEFMNKLRSIGSFGQTKLPEEYKFVAIILNHECKLLVHKYDMMSLPKVLPEKSVNDLKEHCLAAINRGFQVFYDYIETIQRAKDENEARQLRENLCSKLKIILDCKTTVLVNKIVELSCGSALSPHDAMGDAAKQKHNTQQINNCSHLEQINHDFTLKKVDEHWEMLRHEIKTLKAEKAKYKKTIASNADTIGHTHHRLQDQLARTIGLEQEIKQKQDLIDSLQIQRDKANAINIEKDRTISNLQAQVKQDLKANRQDFENLKSQYDKANTSNIENNLVIAKLKAEIHGFKQKGDIVASLEVQRERAEASNIEKDQIISDLQIQVRELKQSKDIIESLQNKFEKANAINIEKDQTIAHLKTLVIEKIDTHNGLTMFEVEQDLQKHGEVDQLQDQYIAALQNVSELAKNLKEQEHALSLVQQELEESREALRRANQRAEHMQEEAERHKQLLEVRSGMIKLLQEQENAYKSKLEGIYFNLNEKEAIISQVNSELARKNEKFKHLYSTLTHKQKIIRCNEQTMKDLEESNKRNIMLRVQQEERNAHSQDQVAHLKSVIRSCYNIIIATDGQPLFETVPPSEIPEACIETNSSANKKLKNIRNKFNYQYRDKKIWTENNPDSNGNKNIPDLDVGSHNKNSQNLLDFLGFSTSNPSERAHFSAFLDSMLAQSNRHTQQQVTNLDGHKNSNQPQQDGPTTSSCYDEKN